MPTVLALIFSFYSSFKWNMFFCRALRTRIIEQSSQIPELHSATFTNVLRHYASLKRLVFFTRTFATRIVYQGSQIFELHSAMFTNKISHSILLYVHSLSGQYYFVESSCNKGIINSASFAVSEVSNFSNF